MAMLITSILLFFSVMGLAISTVPGVTEESTDGYTPTTPYSKNEIYIGRGTSESFSGDPFNCEIWDASTYEEFGVIGEDGYYIAVTDSNSNGTVEDDERCPGSRPPRRHFMVPVTAGRSGPRYVHGGITYRCVLNTIYTFPMVVHVMPFYYLVV
jgi:hypothetical protein